MTLVTKFSPNRESIALKDIEAFCQRFAIIPDRFLGYWSHRKSRHPLVGPMPRRLTIRSADLLSSKRSAYDSGTTAGRSLRYMRNRMGQK